MEGLKKIFIQLSKFACAGLTAGTVNLLSLYLLTEFVGLHYLVSATAAFFLGITLAFFINEKWTFHFVKHQLLSYEKYVFVSGILLLADLGLLYVFVDIWGMWYLISQLIIFPVLGLVNFFIEKYWTFK